MAAPLLPRRAVAALFLARQHLERPRTRRLTASSLLAFVEDVGGLQIDSINVVERGHHLTLWSRFGPYDRPAVERIAYRRRLLFEYWAHAACLVPSSHYPAWRRAMLDYSLRSRAWGAWLQKNRRVLRAVEAAIGESGPLGSLDFAHRRPPGASGGWWDWKPAAHALDYLWMSGRTLVHSRTHFRKRFDLCERVMPEAVGREPLTREGFRRWHLRQSLRALGAARETDLRMYLTFPRAAADERRQALRAALAAASRKRRPAVGTTLLSPFDSFLWHRDRTRCLFGYDYTLEVYTPGHRRVHGYYSMPILHDGQLVGRLDPKTHREERRLEVRAVHFEPWLASRGGRLQSAWLARMSDHIPGVPQAPGGPGGATPLRAASCGRAGAGGAAPRRAGAHHAEEGLRRRDDRGGDGPAVAADGPRGGGTCASSRIEATRHPPVKGLVLRTTYALTSRPSSTRCGPSTSGSTCSRRSGPSASAS